jgi:hypothetical protein
MKNWSSQLFIPLPARVAPERKVIDEYDISGYLTKVEATEQKLYTLIKQHPPVVLHFLQQVDGRHHPFGHLRPKREQLGFRCANRAADSRPKADHRDHLRWQRRADLQPG